ncbi:MAG: hypothetical protein ACHQII_03575 [Bacteroidia bacterium]
MQKSGIRLDFKCPKKWDDMMPQGNGRFCGDCKQVVTDFTKTSLDEILLTDTEQHACGNFYAHQVETPFNDWRDNIVAFYQKTTLRLTNSKLLKPGITFLLMIVLITTGCARKVRGVRGKFSSTKSPNKEGYVQQTAETKKRMQI